MMPVRIPTNYRSLTVWVDDADLDELLAYQKWLIRETKVIDAAIAAIEAEQKPTNDLKAHTKG